MDGLPGVKLGNEAGVAVGTEIVVIPMEGQAVDGTVGGLPGTTLGVEVMETLLECCGWNCGLAPSSHSGSGGRGSYIGRSSCGWSC